MALLTREEILAADDLKDETVPVPEWGGDVKVRCMTAEERDDLGAAITKDGKVSPRGYWLQLLTRTIVDEQGTRLFTAADIEALGKKSVLAMERVFTVADRLNTVNEARIEAAAKN